MHPKKEILRLITLIFSKKYAILISLSLTIMLSTLAYASTVFVPAPNRTDMVHDIKRNMLYIANGDHILRYDMSSNSFASPWALGGNLKGIDISPDNNTLVVGDLSTNNSYVWVHVVNIQDGTDRKILMSQNFAEAGTYAVSFGKDGRIYATSDTAGSGWQPFRQINPQTNTWVNLLTISDLTMVCTSADGNVVGFAEGNISDGRFGSYDITSKELIHQTNDLGTGWFNYDIAVNHDGTRVAIPTYGGTFVYDQVLHKLKVLGNYAIEYADGVAYNPVTNELYLSIANTSLVRVYDPDQLEKIVDLDFGSIFASNYNSSFGFGRIKTSKDGSILFANVNGGVKYMVLPLTGGNTATTISTSENPTMPSHSVILTASVIRKVISPAGLPTGTVKFMDGATILGTGQLSGDPAQATLTTSFASFGPHLITAVYEGDGTFDSSMSAPLQEIVKSNVIRVPSDYPNVQEAIDVAADGDTISVANGTYGVNIDFLGKAISLISESGPGLTVLDGGHKGPVITFSSGEGPDSVISGFTIKNGYADWGGGITIRGSSPTIYGNIFDGNAQASGGFGAAIGGNCASPIIERNYFQNNTCDTQSLSGVVSFVNSSSPLIANNIFTRNPCRAINMTLPVGNSPEVSNNTIVGNNVGIRVDARVPARSQLFRNNIIVGNGVGQEVDFGSTANYPTWKNNLVFNNLINYQGIPNQTAINGNISTDPLFLDRSNADYHLRTGSLAIDAGDNSAPNLPKTDFDGNPRILDGDRNGVAVVDMGAYETCNTDPVRNLRSALTYTSVQDAYEEIANTIGVASGTLQITATNLTGGLILDQNITLTLVGGYNCDYSVITSSSVIQGMVTVNTGEVIVSGIIIQ